MKRIVSLLTAVLLCIALILPASATSSYPRLIDDADLLSDSEETEILELLNEISERNQVDVAILTINNIGGMSPETAADNLYEQLDYGYGANHDGVMLLVAVSSSDWHVTTEGYGITAITDSVIDKIRSQAVPYMSDGDFASAFRTYADICDKHITSARTGVTYRDPFPLVRNLIGSLIIGFVIALIVTMIMKGKLKSVHAATAAADYVRSNSFNVTHSRDLYLYSHTDRRAKPKENKSSTHVSSSGRTHGGGGGKF